MKNKKRLIKCYVMGRNIIKQNKKHIDHIAKSIGGYKEKPRAIC